MKQLLTKNTLTSVKIHRVYAIWALVALSVLVLSLPLIRNGVFEFIFGGHIPGTNLVVPYWIMLTLNVGALLLIALFKIEDMFYTNEAIKKHATKRKSTRRKYSRS